MVTAAMMGLHAAITRPCINETTCMNSISAIEGSGKYTLLLRYKALWPVKV